MKRQLPIDSPELPRAELFGVSDALLAELLDTGETSYRKVGQCRCVLVADVLVYGHSTDAKRLVALDELVRMCEEMSFDDLGPASGKAL